MNRLPFLILFWFCAVAPGCATDEEVPLVVRAPTHVYLRKIAQAYNAGFDEFGNPPDAQDVRDKLALKFPGETVDDLLTSPRDFLPFVILYGSVPDGDNRSTFFVYEQKGSDGTRFGLTLSLEVLELPEAAFLQASFAGGHKPGSK